MIELIVLARVSDSEKLFQVILEDWQIAGIRELIRQQQNGATLRILDLTTLPNLRSSNVEGNQD